MVRTYNMTAISLSWALLVGYAGTSIPLIAANPIPTFAVSAIAMFTGIFRVYSKKVENI